MQNYEQLRQSTLKRSNVFQNVTNTMGRSFISTHIGQDSMAFGDQLRKSRIQNLPNYKKISLGDNPSFVVVFQTIEIQRLSNEVQLLRVKLKQTERQLFNVQNYEVQIRQLTQKCFNYQSELYEYRQEVEKLNKICQTLYHQNQNLKSKLNDMDFSLKQKYQSEKQKNSELQQQIQKWRARYQASQKSKAKQLEDLRNLMQCQRKSMIDRQIRQMTIRFQNERSGLQNQIRKCREMLTHKGNDIQDLKQKLQRYQITIMEMKQNENVIGELQNKIALLSQQLVRLNQVLRDKQNQLHSFKKLEYQLNLKIKEQKQWQHESGQLKSMLENRNKQIQQWKIRASRLQDQAIRGKEMIHYNNELSDKLDLATKQIDRLNSVLKSKLEEIQRWKQKLQEKDIQVSKLRNLQNQIPQYQSKMNMIKAQNDRINGILRSRLQQIQNWKKKCNQLQNNVTRFALMEKDKQVIQDRYNKQIKSNEELKFAYQKLQNDLNTFKKYEVRCRQIQGKNQGLGRQIDRLNNIIRGNNQELQDFKTRHNKLQTSLSEYRNIQIQMKQYQDKIILLTQQIQRLNQLIKTKNADIDLLEKQKLQLHSKMNHYKNYQIKINENEQILVKMQNNCEVLKRDIQNWQNKYRSADARVRQLQNGLFQSNNQKQKLSNQLKTKLNQFDQLRNRHNHLQNQYRQMGDLQFVCKQQHNQIMNYLADIQSLDRKNKQFEKDLGKEKAKANQYTQKILIMTTEIEKANRQLNSNNFKKTKQFQELQESFSRLVSKSKSKDGEIQLLTSKCNQLQSQVQKLTVQFTRLLKAAQKSQSQTVILLKKVQEYQDYAKRISILGAELDRLTLMNKGLEEDNKMMRLKYANNINIQTRQQDMNIKMVLMALQIESLRQRLQQREVNMQEMRKTILEPVRRI